jgi:hypothetical protein
MAKPVSQVPPAQIALYEKLLATQPGLERKGAAMPYTSLNGHMFSFLTADGKLALRLSAEDRSDFLSKYKTKLVEQHGAVMKEYVTVPDALLKKTKGLSPYLAKSIAYIETLKPKPTKKPRK